MKSSSGRCCWASPGPRPSRRPATRRRRQPPAPPAARGERHPRRPAGDIEDFVPTEKVSADDAVAFPVDI